MHLYSIYFTYISGKLTTDSQDGLLKEKAAISAMNQGMSKASVSPQQRVRSPVAPGKMLQSLQTSQSWSQNSSSKRSSLSSEDTQASTPSSISRQPMVSTNTPQQLQVPTVAPQRSRSPFRRGQPRKQTIPTVNLGQRPLNPGQRAQEVGQRTNQSQKQEIGQRSLESSQRSLDSGYRSLENRGRSPVPARARSPAPDIPRGANQISQSTSSLYHRHMSHPPTSAITYSRSIAVAPSRPQNQHQMNSINVSPQIQNNPNLQSPWQQNNYQTTMAAFDSNNDQIDHYSASIQNLSLGDQNNTTKGATTIHVKGDSPDHYRYSDSLPLTDDGYLSPREVRQGMSTSEFHGNQSNHGNRSNMPQNVIETYNSKITRSTPVRKRSSRSVSELDEVPADLSQLTVEEIGHILKLLNLDHHKDKFSQNMIDGAMLMDLAADDLRDLGLSRVECTRLNKFVREGWRPKIQ